MTMTLTPDQIELIAQKVVEQLKPLLSVQNQSELDSHGVAAMLKISKPTVERLTAEGAIPSYLIGRSRRYSREAVLNAVRNQEAQR